MSNQTNDSSRLGVEEIIAVISVLILATIFIGYYLWPAQSEKTPTVASNESTVAAAPAIAAGDNQSNTVVSAEDQNAADGETASGATASPSSDTQSAPENATSSESTVSSPPVDGDEAETASIVDANPEPRPGNTALIEATMNTGATESSSVGESVAQSVPATEPAGGPKSSEISDPVITYLDRDRLTNELIISGVSPQSDEYVALLINGVDTGPIKLDAEKKWRYRFKAGAGEYYVRIMPATEKGPIVRVDALPTLYNISLAPISPESTEAGAEISLLSGEFRKVKKGETLAQIAKQTRMRPQDLRLVNGLAANKSLKEGDVLFIPVTQ